MLDGVAVLGHFQHCSVMRLSCLDELVNNDIVFSVICVIWFGKEGPVFWWNLWLMKVDVLFLSFFARNDNISVGWDFCKRGVEEKSWMDSSDC